MPEHFLPVARNYSKYENETVLKGVDYEIYRNPARGRTCRRDLFM